MPYSTDLAARIRSQLGSAAGITEKKMFGGIGFLINGNMACGVIGEDLVLRIKPEDTTQVLAQPDTRPFDFSGKPMAGWIYVDPAGFTTDPELKDWIQQGIDYAKSLPAK
jgi:TfoX/Sxy family transcriptional regulator of competence genes